MSQRRRNLRAEDRRAQVRAAAVRILERDNVGRDLNLRQIATELDLAMSTLTYVYPNMDELWADLVAEHEQLMWTALIGQIRDGGLQIELERMLARHYLWAMSSPARITFLLYEIEQVAIRGNQFLLELDARRTRAGRPGLVQAIATAAGEHYRIPDHIIGDLLRTLTEGLMLYWHAERDDLRYWRALMAGIEAITLLADPKPLGEAHAGMKHFDIPLPRRADHPPLFWAYPAQNSTESSSTESSSTTISP